MSYYYPRAVIKLKILFEDFQLVSDASKQKTYELFVQPESVSVSVNDHRTSDTFTCELDYKNFPFDPRSMRACGVVIYMQDVKTNYDSDGSVTEIVPDSYPVLDPNIATVLQNTNAVFAGFVDEDSISFDDTKRTVHLEGRDYTALLIDQKYQENVPISFNQPLNVSIQTFLNKIPATAQIKIINATGTTLQTPNQALNDFVPIATILAQGQPPANSTPILAQSMADLGSPLAGQKNPGKKESYWEIIQDMVTRAGLICYMHLDNLVITTPRNLYNAQSDLKFIYGQNVRQLTFKRKLGRLKNFNLRVHSRVGKSAVVADIPEEATPAWCSSYGIPQAKVNIPILRPDGTLDGNQVQPAPYVTFPVANVASKQALVRIGQTIYEDYSRQQLEGSLETHEMLGHSGVDYSDPNFSVFDLTQLEIGQPIAIELAVDDIAAISRISTYAARVQYLVLKNYEETVASYFAATMGQFSMRFYTTKYTVQVDDNGFKLSLNFVNIIELGQRNNTNYVGLQ